MARNYVKSCVLLFSTVLWFFHVVSSQVCSPPGQLCSRTTDCCRGCCEQHMCVERPFSCSPDLVAQPGSSSCQSYHCPRNQICYLREVCPPENPCPRLPFCRRVPPVHIATNHTDSGAFRTHGSRNLLITVTSTYLCYFYFCYRF